MLSVPAFCLVNQSLQRAKRRFKALDTIDKTRKSADRSVDAMLFGAK